MNKLQFEFIKNEYEIKTFNFLSSLHFDSKEGTYELVLSDYISLIYMLDYLFPVGKYMNLLEENFTKDSIILSMKRLLMRLAC